MRQGAAAGFAGGYSEWWQQGISGARYRFRPWIQTIGRYLKRLYFIGLESKWKLSLRA
ncbi:hypothetical protein SAMN05192529_10277 [Arachidicoccus rhizosphaerae]|uniref:Uncharacterized protein n=1 Tax=Arachidicoccus rhizosphaerae TaxID=551991 RepID=A0A1H3W2C0_9BACT|nr:hypothetical protein [Arachidicoccus rhizosphaerae]SDZ81247.1 hypothetical protein SAMN05192529_10277 [Arachidicoccus rhizosphaerae]